MVRMLAYDLIMPFNNQNHDDSSCVSAKDLLPLFNKQKGERYYFDVTFNSCASTRGIADRNKAIESIELIPTNHNLLVKFDCQSDSRVYQHPCIEFEVI